MRAIVILGLFSALAGSACAATAVKPTLAPAQDVVYPLPRSVPVVLQLYREELAGEPLWDFSITLWHGPGMGARGSVCPSATPGDPVQALLAEWSVRAQLSDEATCFHVSFATSEEQTRCWDDERNLVFEFPIDDVLYLLQVVHPDALPLPALWAAR